MIIPRFVVGARLAVLRGDRAAAANHLDEGADIADRLSIPRLSASVENERVRLGLPTRRVGRPPVEFAQRQRPVDGIDEITAQLEEDTAIRLLITGSREQIDIACRWAQEWVDRLKGRGRHRASLRAERLLAECLSAAGRTAQAKQLLGSVLARCADLGMVRFPIGGGERLVSLIAELRNDQKMGRSDPMMPQQPMAYFDRILDAAGRGTTGIDEEEESPRRSEPG
jgi:serine/threonine-protein kinase PknK